ncbi:putative transcription factor Hap3/NF-YB family [Helianthus anomalus]
MNLIFDTSTHTGWGVTRALRVLAGQFAHSIGHPSPPAQFAQQQLAYQHIHQQQQHQQLHQQLQNFWANQYQEIEQTTDFKNHSLPLARTKKIKKADEDVRMILAKASIIFARACEMFILELTLRSWNHTEENKRRTLQKKRWMCWVLRWNWGI